MPVFLPLSRQPEIMAQMKGMVIYMSDTRLEMIYDLIPCGVICDVGTDHCKLAAKCVQSGKSERAYATDVREGPLSAAKRLIEKEGLGDRITTYLSDGFLQIPKAAFDDTHCFVIAGMGGELISRIISGRHTDKYIAVQPMTAINELIDFFASEGYEILKHTLCRDGDKIYNAMLVKYDGTVRKPDYYGNIERNGLFYEYMKREKARVQKAINGINSSEKSDKSRLVPLVSLVEIIEKEFLE